MNLVFSFRLNELSMVLTSHISSTNFKLLDSCQLDISIFCQYNCSNKPTGGTNLLKNTLNLNPNDLLSLYIWFYLSFSFILASVFFLVHTIVVVRFTLSCVCLWLSCSQKALSSKLNFHFFQGFNKNQIVKQ